MRVKRTGERTVTATARRAQIVDAAIETVAELGLNQASFARIAERAGLSSTRLISYHFAGKDDLMQAVVDEVFRTAGQYIAPFVLAEPTPSAKLRGFIRGSARFYAEYRRHVVAVRDVWANFRRPDGTQRFGMEAHEPEFEVVSQILREGQARGEFREFDPRVMAVTLRQALDGLATLVATDPDLDVDGYTGELVALFDRATRA
ncbi:TetR family transcriptional regulator [Pseudonocardia hierapolitana]|uniref:TetR family transcriptional regulator n=1 Tax=Pseudonocardia hierapolitana TaxID=1128676 RepID=A0A561SIF9_9PSEU|nr:TetR/AcrR family transcriptional regulator [Pseudonocardia hierapolitana]TWF74670.1 TetR family transcriptional regulator [Pseudonocardia hierapolitana]